MIEFGPHDCDLEKNIFLMEGHGMIGTEVTVPDDILARQKEVSIRGTMKKFKNEINQSLIIQLPQLKAIGIPQNRDNYDTYEALRDDQYWSQPYQGLHQDGNGERGPSAFLLKKPRDFATLVTTKKLIHTEKIPRDMKHSSEPTAEELENAYLQNLDELIDAHKAVVVNNCPGLVFLNDDLLYHARFPMKPIEEINFSKQGVLHCFDLELNDDY